MTSAFDIIGDVHGQFDKLVGLLLHLAGRRRGFLLNLKHVINDCICSSFPDTH